MFRVFARQSLDDGVGRLARAGIKDLHVGGAGSRLDLSSFAVKDDYHAHTGPILIISQPFDQCFTRQRGPPRVELAQFWPGKNEAVPIDDQITGSLRHCYSVRESPNPSRHRKIELNLLFRGSFLPRALLAWRRL